MKVLVTGASGFLGNFLVNQDVHSQIQFRAVYRNEEQAIGRAKDFSIINNIDSETNWTSSFKNINVILHTAARAHVMQDESKNPKQEYDSINIDGTLNLASQALEFGIKRFIYISSAKVNGESSQYDRPFTEKDKPNPVGDYAISKYKAEQGLIKLSEREGLDLTIIRPALIYGPGVRANFLSIMKLIQRGIPLPLRSIKNHRSFISLYNLHEFILECLLNQSAINQTFLISDGKDLSIGELVVHLADALKKRNRLIPFPPNLIQFFGLLLRQQERTRRLCDSFHLNINKSKVLLNFQPKYTMAEGLKKTAEHFNKDLI
tara:strand:- start:9599 stop:10555 length:957 start_codon:yes stop_codon:yes gene_type:complete